MNITITDSPKPTPSYYLFDERKVLAELKGAGHRLVMIRRARVRDAKWLENVSDMVTACVFYVERGHYREADRYLVNIRKMLCGAEDAIKQNFRAGRRRVVGRHGKSFYVMRASG